MKKRTHGTDAVMNGKLHGATDQTDYFYFFCPKCPKNHMLRVLDYSINHEEPGNRYNDTLKSKAPRSFVIAFDLYCEQCGLRDCVKVSNVGWQDGQHAKALGKP
ncbi:MAG: hypothetical protein LBM04_07960 [Opitutaceae bacterium]|nr:hypothetical protein [Opitutaceae bacterium]